MANDSAVALGRRLSAAIAYRNASMVQVARETDISRTTLWRYLNGETTQPFEVVARLADVLRVRLDYLAYEDGPMARAATTEYGVNHD